MTLHTNDAHPVWEGRTIPRPPVSDRPGGDRPVGDRPGGFETALFRFVLLYVGLQLLPLDGHFFRNLVDFDGGYTRYLFNLSKYAPRFFGPDTFADWGVIVGLALVGVLIWSVQQPKAGAEDRLYLWLRVAVRYRLALAVIAYGFIKLFPIQAPLPSLSNLNTAYGDHSAWKLFSLTLGVVPGYQSFLGAVELLGGLLLLNRKTTAIGTLILLPFLGNVFFSNLAYEGGEYVYSGLLLTFGLFLFGHDAVRLFRLLSLEVPAAPNRQTLRLSGTQKTVRLALKTAFIVLAVGLYGFTTGFTSRKARLPQTPGLPGLAGIYRVSEFTVNGKPIPYSKQPGIGGPIARWQDVVFEEWNTLSIRSNQPLTLHTAVTEELPADESGRDYEFAGSQGRHFYRYTADPTGTRLTLQNPNPNHAGDRLSLTLVRRDDSTLLLSGTDAQGAAISAVLTKVDKKYLLHEAAKAGRRGALTL